MLDLNLIRVFTTVFEHLSYTRAAQELGISQPAASQAIRRLEKQLGTQLFVKEGRGIIATAHANHLAKDLQPAIHQIDNAMASRRDIIAYGTEAVLHFLGDVPGVKFVLSNPYPELALQDIRSNRVEMLIDNTTTKDKSFVVEELSREIMVVICAADHPRITGDQISWEQFFSEEHVVLKTLREGRQLVDAFAKMPLPPRKDKIEALSLSSVVTMVARTELIGVVSLSIAKLWAKSINIRYFSLPFEVRDTPIHMVYHQRHRSDPFHRQVRERIKQKASETISTQILPGS